MRYIPKNLSPKSYLKNAFNDITLNHFPSIYRPSSYPLISGDYFRKISNHIFDESKTLDPTHISDGDLVFLKGEYYENYFINYHTKINASYVLIIHNSVLNINENIENFLDSKIIHCFAKNLSITNSKKLSYLPVGFKNKRYLNNDYYQILGEFYRNNNKSDKLPKIFSCFSTNTHPERVELNNTIQEINFINHYEQLNITDYFNELSKYKFTLCPRGSGQDSYRIWESLLVGSIPITLKNTFSINLKMSGVPILLLDNWNELNGFQSNSAYMDFISHEDGKKFTTGDYWSDLINKKR
tara:strand:- start:12854 stop:13747 length:894 start_codon:yes stop_codon:yes gene_type:complete